MTDEQIQIGIDVAISRAEKGLPSFTELLGSPECQKIIRGKIKEIQEINIFESLTKYAEKDSYPPVSEAN